MKVIDTRDLMDRKEELEALRDALDEAQTAFDEHKFEMPAEDSEERDEWEEKLQELADALDDADGDFGKDEWKELEELEELEDEISDFLYGETMIPVEDFEDYARELAEDIGAIDRNASWPNTCIDWEKAAEELAMDYKEVSYQGVDYYVRA